MLNHLAYTFLYMFLVAGSTMKTLNQDIRERYFRPVYLLYGEEAFLKNSYKKRFKEAIGGKDMMNISSFEGKGLDVDEIIRLAETMPFFAQKRLILVENSGFFKSANEVLAKYLPNVPDTTCLFFVEDEVDKRNRLFKRVKELGYAVELGRQNASQLARWAAEILSKEGKQITGKTMELFLGMTGNDMGTIRMELEKLISYTGTRETITDQDVKDICTEHISGKIFEMIAAIANRQTRKAMDFYEDLLALKEPPMRILFLIARQFNQILQVKELSQEGLERKTIASKLKVQPFVVERVIRQARQFTREQILTYINLCINTEESVKSGRLQDRLAVEILITYQYGESEN